MEDRTPAQDFLACVQNKIYGTILADPPWQFHNRTGKVVPEHKRLSRYTMLTFEAINDISVWRAAAEQSPFTCGCRMGC